MNQTKQKVQKMPQRGKKKAPSKQKQQSIRFVLIAVIVLTAVLIILGTLVFSADKVISDDSVSSENSEILSAVSSDEMGFPVTFSNNDIIRTESFSSKIFVLGKKILTCISAGGTVKFNHIFTFTDPEMTVSEKYGIVYDRASSKYLIFNSRGVIFEGETENGKHIITADINNRGDVALVTKSDDSACRVSLADKKGKVIYIWSCAEEYGVSVDLSEDGQEILCGVIGSADGTLYSQIYLLDIHSDEAAVGYKTEDSALIDVKLSGKKAIVTCNNGRSIYTFRSSGVKEEHIPYLSENASLIYSDKNGNTAVAAKKIGSFNTNEIYVYNKNNDIIYVGYTDEEIVDVICRGKKVYLLSDSAIYESLSDGTFEAVGTEEISGEGMVICKSRLYYYSTGHVDINS